MCIGNAKLHPERRATVTCDSSGGTALGAAIGGLTGGVTGAVVGGAVGATTGTIAATHSGNKDQAAIPTEAVLTFTVE